MAAFTKLANDKSAFIASGKYSRRNIFSSLTHLSLRKSRLVCAELWTKQELLIVARTFLVPLIDPVSCENCFISFVVTRLSYLVAKGNVDVIVFFLVLKVRGYISAFGH